MVGAPSIGEVVLPSLHAGLQTQTEALAYSAEIAVCLYVS